MSRVVVVGAGLGGLAVSARLAARGHHVTLVEQAATVGGKLGVLARDGHVFDTGPSLLTMPHLVTELLADTGSSAAATGLRLRRLEQAAHYRFPDGTRLDLPGDVAAIPAALDAALGAGTGDQWGAFLGRAERIWDATHADFLESPVSARDLARLSHRVRDVATVAPWLSLRGLGRRYLHDPRLRQLLDRYATYTGSDPRRAPAALAAVPWVEQAYGSWYVEGGLRRIAEVVHERARQCGVEVLLSRRVEQITHRGRVDGVVLSDGTRLSADVVVADADAGQVYDRLVDSPAVGPARRRLARATPSLSGFVLCLALDGGPRPPGHHTVLFAEDYDAEFDAVFGAGGSPRPVPRPTVYVAAPDDPTTVPRAGAQSWFVLVNAPRHDPGHGVDWDRPGLAERYADGLLAELARRGLDVRPHLLWREVRTPADLARDTMTPGGSIYGSSSNGARAAFLRPANRTDLPGLYLVGGSAHPGGGLPLVLLSARIVADLVGPARD